MPASVATSQKSILPSFLIGSHDTIEIGGTGHFFDSRVRMPLAPAYMWPWKAHWKCEILKRFLSVVGFVRAWSRPRHPSVCSLLEIELAQLPSRNATKRHRNLGNHANCQPCCTITGMRDHKTSTFFEISVPVLLRHRQTYHQHLLSAVTSIQHFILYWYHIHPISQPVNQLLSFLPIPVYPSIHLSILSIPPTLLDSTS